MADSVDGINVVEKFKLKSTEGAPLDASSTHPPPPPVRLLHQSASLVLPLRLGSDTFDGFRLVQQKKRLVSTGLDPSWSADTSKHTSKARNNLKSEMESEVKLPWADFCLITTNKSLTSIKIKL